MRVFVLLFNANTENEGIHTIREGDRNKVLMFESEDDATRFSLMLEAQDFPTATVEAIDPEEVKEFCAEANFDWELIPENSALVLPPDTNVDETDWQAEAEKQKPTDMPTSEPDLDSIRRRLEGLL
ncbi:MAG: DUF3110 domain-containing protein [Scytonematopsis contorta HA4267-MV1]|jgi:hypothetical protein|nr:DUF3110 domain-containing protein [Scytonematopsis contorta HA4267-MV1]